MSAANQQQETQLIPVGAHECVTCERCATTFAAVHPACPSCSAGERAWQVIKARLAAAETALQRIRENARDWHGPLISIAGYERALGVIATWCDEALASPDAAAKEPTDYLYPGCGCPQCRAETAAGEARTDG